MAFTTYYTVNTLASSLSTARDIVDVAAVDEGEAFAPMGLAVRIPQGVSIQGKPKVLSTLLTAKYAGILAAYQGYTRIAMDPCLSPSQALPYPGLSTGNCSNYVSGTGAVNHLLLPGGVLVFQTLTLAAPVESLIMTWETYGTEVSESFGTLNTPGALNRFYVPKLDSTLQCRVSFGAGYFTVPSSGAVVNVAPNLQGTTLVVRFENLSQSPAYLGSWALVY
jgi:hypothetical protein